jgi:hypothetical protein
MATTRTLLTATVIVIVVAVVAAGLYVTVSATTGTVSVRVKDQPAEWSHVNVTFSEVQVHQIGGDNSTGWKTLAVSGGTIDLIPLTNISAFLASASIPTGQYTQIRIVVSSATGVMLNGTHVAFTVPSGELKTTNPFNVTPGDTTTLILEFDLSQSIIHNASGWIFKPVLGRVV